MEQPQNSQPALNKYFRQMFVPFIHLHLYPPAKQHHNQHNVLRQDASLPAINRKNIELN